jgi:hypothetical protein
MASKAKSYFKEGEETEARFASDYRNHIIEKHGCIINSFLELLEKKKCLKEELILENVKRSFKQELITTKIASFDNNVFAHWDLKLFNEKIDVKGLRKPCRSENLPDENFHYVELKNVQGNLGWLYGEADVFAFELQHSWVIVQKDLLQEFIKEKCSHKTKVDSPELYKLYTRHERKDVITLVKSLDLCQISREIVKKQK